MSCNLSLLTTRWIVNHPRVVNKKDLDGGGKKRVATECSYHANGETRDPAYTFASESKTLLISGGEGCGPTGAVNIREINPSSSIRQLYR